MKIKVKKIGKNIFLLVFKTKKDVASTLLRFQEFYESPKFKGKIFSLKEFKKWYIKHSPKGKKTGKFTYFKDWGGFNIPSNVLKPFYKGKFNPLSKKEKQILKLFKDVKGRFYIIATYEKQKTKELKSHLKHEIAHGLFYLILDYRKEIAKLVKKFNLKELEAEILSLGSYSTKVLVDECHAYGLAGEEILSYIPKNFKKKLARIYKKYLDLHKINLSKILKSI